MNFKLSLNPIFQQLTKPQVGVKTASGADHVILATMKKTSDLEVIIRKVDAWGGQHTGSRQELFPEPDLVLKDSEVRVVQSLPQGQ